MIGGSILIGIFAVLAVIYRAAITGRLGPGMRKFAEDLINWWGN